ncbi:MAG: class I SAM-dependent methyltransferase [Actinobacteria bacterium]|nr:class I SAM-dependent methyltransferase [Actinomycetota bacterium]
MTRYDAIGRGYAQARRADPRIQRQIHAALGDARTVVNVGAGTGNYEPFDRAVIAVEPAATMLGQRPPDAAPAVQAVAEHLPFLDRAFDAALAVLTIHHWSELDAGLAELQRVAQRQVILLFEPELDHSFWLVADYVPEWSALPTERTAPGVAAVAPRLNVRSVEVVPVPADCQDGFGGAYWNRPEMYLEPEVHAGISSLAQLPAEVLARMAKGLRRDLESGAWDARYGALRAQTQIDLGYRLVIAG